MSAGVEVTLNYGDCKIAKHHVLQSSLAAQELDLHRGQKASVTFLSIFFSKGGIWVVVTVWKERWSIKEERYIWVSKLEFRHQKAVLAQLLTCCVALDSLVYKAGRGNWHRNIWGLEDVYWVLCTCIILSFLNVYYFGLVSYATVIVLNFSQPELFLHKKPVHGHE